MGLVAMITVRDAVDRVCAAIDAGEIQPSEEEILALALIVERDGGVLKHDLVVKLASRCKLGQAALKKIAQ